MVFSTTWLEFKDIAQDPVRREPVSASCNRRPDEGLETQKYSLYAPRNIQLTVPYGGGSVTVWGCISHDCKLDLVAIQGNLTGDQCFRDVLQPVVVPHFYNHLLATRPVYMASHEPGFESHRAYLEQVRPSFKGSGTSCAKH